MMSSYKMPKQAKATQFVARFQLPEPSLRLFASIYPIADY
jgi:hypothetical protein